MYKGFLSGLTWIFSREISQLSKKGYTYGRVLALVLSELGYERAGIIEQYLRGE